MIPSKQSKYLLTFLMRYFWSQRICFNRNNTKSPNIARLFCEKMLVTTSILTARILLLLKRPEPIQLTLMNTSFYFQPHKLLGNYFKKHCERLDQEFLGLTLSNEEFPMFRHIFSQYRLRNGVNIRLFVGGKT